MKKRLTLIEMMALLLLVGLSSCTKKPEDLIVGKWKITEFYLNLGSDGGSVQTNDAIGETWNFKENGSISGYLPASGDFTNDGFFSSHYIIEDETLTIKGGDFEHHESNGHIEEFVFILDIDEVTKDELSISGKWKFYENGEVHENGTLRITFKRKKS